MNKENESDTNQSKLQHKKHFDNSRGLSLRPNNNSKILNINKEENDSRSKSRGSSNIISNNLDPNQVTSIKNHIIMTSIVHIVEYYPNNN